MSPTGPAAVFVDAGYLFLGGTRALFGEAIGRKDVEVLDAGSIVSAIRGAAERALGSKLDLLRVYWYDGAPDGLATREQEEIGRVARVQLRLGRVSRGRQKGVDGLIIMDLLTLAMNEAISTAVVVSGDEDLREAVHFAQNHGVTVVLIGMPGAGEDDASTLLVRDADLHVNLTTEELASFMEERESVEASSLQPTSVRPMWMNAPLTRPVSDGFSVNVEIDVLAEIVEGVLASPEARDFGVRNQTGVGGPVNREVDKVLLRRLVERTGRYEIDPDLAFRARQLLLDMADARGGA